MSLDHEAIYKAYAGTVVTIDDSAGAFDKDGKSVTLDQSKINTARKEIDDAAAAVKYKSDRAAQYPPIGDQLDALYHANIFPTEMAEKIRTVKDRNPKPS